MLNNSGALAVLDHHIGLNWDDGATLLRVGAQVRYRFGAYATVHTLRVNASARCSDEPLGFAARNGDLRATWTWADVSPGYVVQLAVTNEGEDDVLLDALDVLRIDAAFGGLFNIGAPPGLWRVAHPATSSRAAPKWELWSPDVSGYARQDEFLIQPSASNRTTPPAIIFRTVQPDPAHPVSFELRAHDTFEQFVATCAMSETPLASGVTVVSPELWLAAGDDARELRRSP
jgi:hypothetical protein